MSTDLSITPAIQSSSNVVEDQSGNKSQLYLATDKTSVGTSEPLADTALTVFGKNGEVAIATVRPGDGSRWHWRGMSNDKPIFTIVTNEGAFQLWVQDETGEGQQRLTITPDGKISLSGDLIVTGDLTLDGNLTVKESVTFNGLEQLSGADLVIDKATGKIGHQ